MRWTEEELAVYNARKLDKHPPLPTIVEDAEGPFLRKVVALAKQYGWSCYHTHDSRRSEFGFPDLVLVRNTSLIFAELKSRTGKLTIAQVGWLEALRRTGKVEVYLWKPDDWPQIRTCLTAPSHPSPAS